EFPVSKEADLAASGRPEWRDCAVSAFQRLRRQRIERAQPQTAVPLFIPFHKNQPLTVGRDGGGVSAIGKSNEGRLLRRRDEKANRVRGALRHAVQIQTGE